MPSNQGLQIHKLVSKDLSNSLYHFCDQINNSDADLFVVLAQKAVCLFQILLSQNLLKSSVRTRYVTSHALDFCLNHELKEFKGKIALIDDIMITGYSLANIAATLVRNGIPAENIQIIALARDTAYQAIQFTDLQSGKSKFYCAIETVDPQCTKLSYQICEAMTYYGKPYDSDFPEYKESKAKRFVASKWMNPSLWISYETTPDHAPCGVSTWTMFPTEVLKDRLWEVLGISIDQNVHLKARLYTKEYPDGSCDINFVPMALFHEISAGDLNRLCSFLIQQPLEEAIHNCSLRAKLRLLQYYIAYCLYTAVSGFMTGQPLQCPSLDDLKILFGPHIAKQLQTYLQSGRDAATRILPFDATLCGTELLDYPKHEDKFDIQSILKLDDHHAYELTSELLKPFEYWDKAKEIPSRKEISKKSRHYLLDFAEIKEIRDHLDTGFSLHGLQQVICSAQDYFNSEYLVSVFVDRAIDNGLIVPILYEYEDNAVSKQHCICQAYRHGEDLSYGHADKERLLYFLKCLDTRMQELNGGMPESIAFVTFHKMVALFYQLGLKQGSLFNRFLGFGNDPFLQERFCVHGIVQTIRSNSPFSDDPPFYVSAEDENNANEEPLTKFLVQKLCTEGFIAQEKSWYKRYIIQTDAIDHFVSQMQLDSENAVFGSLSKDVVESIDLIARIIASWYVWKYSHGGEKVKDTFKKDITSLTSCVDIYSFSSAIGTEVHYFKRYWTQNARGVLYRIIGGEECGGDEFINPNAEQALFSGREKNDFFNDNRALIVIDEVTQLLEEVREYLRNAQATHKDKLAADAEMVAAINLWKDSWKSVQTLKDSDKTPLWEDVRQLLKYLYFYSMCYTWLVDSGTTSNVDILLESSDSYQSYKKNFPQEAQSNLALFKELFQEENHSERAKIFLKKVNSKVQKSEELIDQVVKKLAGKTDSYTIRYDSVLLLSIGERDIKVSDQMLRDVWNVLPENAEKTRFNMIHLSSGDNYQQYGVFYNDPYVGKERVHNGMGNQPFNQLLQFYKEFLPIACKGAYSVSAVLVPHLPPNVVFSHNLRRNVEKHAANFKSRFSDPLLASLPSTPYIHQLQLVLTTYTTPDQANAYVQELCNLPGFKKNSDLTALNISEPEDMSKFAEFVVDTQLGNPTSPTVKILYNGSTLGAGFLFHSRGTIFCITCQHLLDGRTTSGFSAQLDNGYSIPLTPLNYKPLIPPNTTRLAGEEILILNMKCEITTPCNSSIAFSKERCGNPWPGQTLSCVGYPEGYPRGHSMTIQTQARLGDGYVEGKTDGAVAQGYSGAGLIDQDKKLCGMHACHPEQDPTAPLFVPAQTIIDILTSLQKETLQYGGYSQN